MPVHASIVGREKKNFLLFFLFLYLIELHYFLNQRVRFLFAGVFDHDVLFISVHQRYYRTREERPYAIFQFLRNLRCTGGRTCGGYFSLTMYDSLETNT